MLVTTLSYIALAAIIWKHRTIFFGQWNVGQDSYRKARSALLAVYALCWMLLIFLLSFEGWDVFLTGEGRRYPGTTPFLKVFSLLFVCAVLMLDANFGQSRKRRYERNFFKHWLLGWTFIPPIVASCALNRPLVALFAIVAVSGWFMRKPGAAKPV